MEKTNILINNLSTEDIYDLGLCPLNEITFQNSCSIWENSKDDIKSMLTIRWILKYDENNKNPFSLVKNTEIRRPKLYLPEELVEEILFEGNLQDKNDLIKILIDNKVWTNSLLEEDGKVRDAKLFLGSNIKELID